MIQLALTWSAIRWDLFLSKMSERFGDKESGGTRASRAVPDWRDRRRESGRHGRTDTGHGGRSPWEPWLLALMVALIVVAVMLMAEKKVPSEQHRSAPPWDGPRGERRLVTGARVVAAPARLESRLRRNHRVPAPPMDERSKRE